ncbi:MAG: MoaD/ThiS family protein [Candidatus Bathyarchaeota archaeon]|nr:MAG: MoaD/ThiS family protein [Candidatus Bathyarchaeota archaeon]
MKVRVRVFGDLVPVLGRNHIVDLEDGETVGSLTNRMAGKAGLKRRGYLGNYRVSGGDLAILVNGRNIDLLEGLETSLQDGDEIVLMPPAAGG